MATVALQTLRQPSQNHLTPRWTSFHFTIVLQVTLTFALLTFAQQDIFQCDFDSWPCAIILDPTGDFDWLRYRGKTPTEFTGPDRGQGNSTWYFYVESSDPRQPNDEARFSTYDLGFVGDVCVRFYYYAYGQGVGELIIYTQIGSNYTINHADWWTLRWDQGVGWKYQWVDIHLNETNTKVGWNGVRGMNWMGDIAVDTIHIQPGRCFPDVSLPWSCDFETDDLCGMRQRNDDDFEWFRWSGPTPTQNTGPLSAQSGSYYAYISTSPALAPGTKAALETPVILYSGFVCVNFWYSMYGSTMGNLSLYSLNLGQDRPWRVWTASTGQNWTRALVTVQLIDYNDRVGFLGVRGSDIYGDIAIDNIRIDGNRCPGDNETTTISIPTTARRTTPLPTTTSHIITTITRATTTTTTTTTTPTTTSRTTVTTATNRITTTTVATTRNMTTPDFGNLPRIYLPWSCDFEVDECGMEQRNFVTFIWTRLSGPSDLTGQTGPRGAESGQYYMFLNSSFPRKQGDNAVLQTPRIVFYGPACVRFWYNLNGRDIGRLILYSSQPGRGVPWMVWSGNHGPQWLLAEVTIFIDYDRVGIISEVGGGPLGQIAIDNLSIVGQPCSNSAVNNSTTVRVTPPSVTTAGITMATKTTDVPSSSFHYPFVRCDMEGDGSLNTRCRLRQDVTDDFDWTGMSGETPSGMLSSRVIDNSKYPVTGPIAAEEGRYYLYTEATGTRAGQVARLIAEGDDFNRGSDRRCLRFFFNMNGFHTGTLRVFARFSDGSLVTEWEMTGDKGPQWRRAAIDFNMTSITQIGVEAVMAGEFSGDMAIDNLMMTSGQCQNPPPNATWACSFELADGSVSLCGMTQPPDADFEWTLWSGKTPSDDTGPSAAYSLPYFIYTEASAPRVQGDRAEILIPKLYQTGSLCLSFYYNMNGFHMGTLEVYLVANGSKTTLWSLSGNHGDFWLRANVPIPFQADSQIGFRGIRGSDFSGDMALDSISVANGNCSSSS